MKNPEIKELRPDLTMLKPVSFDIKDGGGALEGMVVITHRNFRGMTFLGNTKSEAIEHFRSYMCLLFDKPQAALSPEELASYRYLAGRVCRTEEVERLRFVLKEILKNSVQNEVLPPVAKMFAAQERTLARVEAG